MGDACVSSDKFASTARAAARGLRSRTGLVRITIAGALLAGFMTALTEQFGVWPVYLIATTIPVAMAAGLAAFSLDLSRVLSPPKAFPLAYAVFYGLGLIPITAARGSIHSLVVLELIAGLAALVIGLWVGKGRQMRYPPASRSARSARMLRWTGTCLLVSSWLALVHLATRYGIGQAHGFLGRHVSTYLIYVTEWSFPGTLLLAGADLLRRERIGRTTLGVALATAGAVAIVGYRGTVVQILIGLLVLDAVASRQQLAMARRLRVAAIGALALLVINAGYVVRRESSEVLMDVEGVIEFYEVPAPAVTSFILPLHFAAREGPGLMSQMMPYLSRLDDQLPREAIFFADFLTVLPGRQSSAGQLLKAAVGAGGNPAGLAPSLAGGLFLSFGTAGVVMGLFILGWFLARLYALAQRWGTLGAILYAAAFTLFLHWLYRGFFKPAYVMHIGILTFVVLVVRARERQWARFAVQVPIP